MCEIKLRDGSHFLQVEKCDNRLVLTLEYALSYKPMRLVKQQICLWPDEAMQLIAAIGVELGREAAPCAR